MPVEGCIDPRTRSLPHRCHNVPSLARAGIFPFSEPLVACRAVKVNDAADHLHLLHSAPASAPALFLCVGVAFHCDFLKPQQEIGAGLVTVPNEAISHPQEKITVLHKS
jgi:hypothetical protein